MVSCGPARQRCCMRPASKRESFFFFTLFPPFAACGADTVGGSSSSRCCWRCSLRRCVAFFHSALHYGGINETGGRGTGWREGLLGLAAHCRLYPSHSSLRGGGGPHLGDGFTVGRFLRGGRRRRAQTSAAGPASLSCCWERGAGGWVSPPGQDGGRCDPQSHCSSAALHNGNNCVCGVGLGVECSRTSFTPRSTYWVTRAAAEWYVSNLCTFDLSSNLSSQHSALLSS